MEKIEKLEWNEELSVDIPEIDELQKLALAPGRVSVDRHRLEAGGRQLVQSPQLIAVDVQLEGHLEPQFFQGCGNIGGVVCRVQKR